MQCLSSKQFTWDKATGLGIAEATDLFGRDGIPMEFKVRSEKTEDVAHFYGSLAHTRTDREGDILAFVFRSHRPHNITVEVIND